MSDTLIWMGGMALLYGLMLADVGCCSQHGACEGGFPAGAVIECYHTGMQPRRILYIRSSAHWEHVYPHVEAACEKWSNKHD